MWRRRGVARPEPTHRLYLYDTTLVVPLIVYPRLSGRSLIDEQVRLVDVAPTILSLLNVATEHEFDGQSLVDLMRAAGGSGGNARPLNAYSETIFELMQPDREVEILSCCASLRVYPWKLIWNRLNNSCELYRVDSDPHEKNNCAGSNGDVLAGLLAELRESAAALPEGVIAADETIVERLAALGYLER
jgi:arylsulfatase A-like enzyme